MQVVQNTFRLEEVLNSLHLQWIKERELRGEASKALANNEQNIEALKKKLGEEESARKAADLAVSSFKKQAEDQGKKLRDATDQLKASKESASLLMKQLEEAQSLRARAEKEKDEAEQRGYDEGVAETEERFGKEVPMVCRAYCAQTWEEALNRAGVEPSSSLRSPGNIFFPSAIRASSALSQQQDVSSTVVNLTKEVQSHNPLSTSQQTQPETSDAEKRTSPSKVAEAPKDGQASQTFKKDLASTVLPAGEVPKEKEKEKGAHPQEAVNVPPPKAQIKLNK